METKRRTAVRAIGYRVVALGITALFVGLSSAVIIHIILTAVHYVYERIWLTINWGKL